MNRSCLFSALFLVFSLLLVACGEKEQSIDVASIAISQPSAEMEIGESLSLKATVSPSNAVFDGYSWTSTNPKVATVTNSGMVTAISEGNTIITVMAGGKTASCAVTVNKPYVYVTSVTLDKSSISLYEGAIDNLKARVSPDNADNPSLQWSSSNPDVVLVTADGVNGKVFALAPGTAIITVTTVDGGFTGTCKVTVYEVQMELKPPTLDILVGQEATIEVSLAQQLEGVSLNIHWTSTDDTIVSVDSNGHVKAFAAGDAVVFASTENGKTASCKVHVRNKVESVTITAPAGERDINIGETLQLKVVVTPADLTGVDIVWESSDPSIATVSADGLVTAKKQGTVTITVTVKNGPGVQTATYDIEVVQPVTSISVSPATLTMYVGDELVIDDVFTIELRPQDASDRSVHFGFSRTGILKIENGKLTGLKAGEVVLYIYPNKSNSPTLKAECKITVKARVEKITLPTTKTIQENEALQLIATVTPSNADQEVVWSSSKPEVATVSENGLVKGVKAGTTVIRATSKENPSITATCTVTVQAKTIAVTGVSLNMSSMTLTVGEKQTLKATITPSNATNKSVSWSSNNTTVASVSSSGVVTAKAAGTAKITVKTKDGGKTATCSVTVQDVGPKGYKVFIKHGAEFKYDEISSVGTYIGSAFTYPYTKYNYAGDNHELHVSSTSTELSNMFNELGMTYSDFQSNYDIDEPVLMVKDANHSEPGDLPDEGKCEFFVNLYEIDTIYEGLVVIKLAPSSWDENALDLTLILSPDVSLGGPHFIYVVYRAKDNTKYVDAVVKFVYRVK